MPIACQIRAVLLLSLADDIISDNDSMEPRDRSLSLSLELVSLLSPLLETETIVEV